MKNFNLFILLLIITSLTIYFNGFSLTKIIIPTIVYFASLKKDTWVDKEMKK